MAANFKFLFLCVLINLTQAQAFEADLVRQGLRLLYKNISCSDASLCLNEKTEPVLIKNAIQFKNKFDSLVVHAPAPTVSWKQTGLLTKEFEFDSLVQRQPGHPSNKVKGVIYYPRLNLECNEPVPATYFCTNSVTRQNQTILSQRNKSLRLQLNTIKAL